MNESLVPEALRIHFSITLTSSPRISSSNCQQLARSCGKSRILPRTLPLQSSESSEGDMDTTHLSTREKVVKSMKEVQIKVKGTQRREQILRMRNKRRLQGEKCVQSPESKGWVGGMGK